MTKQTSLITVKDRDESKQKWDAKDETGLRFEQVHERVVMVLLSPVALPFEQGRNGGQPYCACLHHAREGRLLRRRRSRATTILDDVNVVTRADHFDGGDFAMYPNPNRGDQLFLNMTPDEAATLRAQGFDFYDWAEREVRFVVSWDQDERDIAKFATAIAAL